MRRLYASAERQYRYCDYHDSESALAPATIVGLLAMGTAYNQLLVVSFLALTLDIVDLLLPKTV